MSDRCPDCGVFGHPDGHRHRTTLPDLKALGITYRQLDYWTRRGILRCDGNTTPGSGGRRTWDPAELDVAKRIGRLVRIGLALDVAAHIAREPGDEHEVAPGVVVVLREAS